ncbi:MAG TPA: hypothetical protein VMZ53_20765 [Kofleriaceae bacterium]|nr:hypothetical protein [Kofleriaceae bacterium]
MGRFEPTGPVDVPGLEHSVANLSWGVLRGALGPSDGTAGAASNVPSALGVLRHADIYKGVPDEIEEAFAVLERHVVRDGQLYPVVVAALPFLFATLRKGTFIATRIADLIALYASTAHTLEAPLDTRVRQLISDHGGEIARWLGHHDRALGAIAIHVPALRDIFIAAVEGAERVSPEILLALVELGDAPGETPELALKMFDGPDASDIARTCAAAFLARFGDHAPELRTRIDAALPPSATTHLRRLAGNLWNPVIVRPLVAPKLYDAEILFTGKKVVVVKAGSKSVTLPWEGAALVQGDRVQVGLSAHGQPKLAVVTDRKGNVRVIDF